METNDYFWIKMKEHFFEDDKIIYLLSQKNGEKYVIFWIKLLLKCLKNKDSDNKEYGFLRFTDKIPYDDNLLSKVFNIDIDTVRVAIEYFLQLDMIEILDDKTIYIEEVNKMIGKYNTSTDRVRKHREKKKLLIKNNVTNETFHNVSCNDNIEVEKELELEIEEEDKPDDSIESLSFFCPYCLEENSIRMYTNKIGEIIPFSSINDNQIVNFTCHGCKNTFTMKKKETLKFLKDMNKNYKYYALAELLYTEHRKTDDKFLAGKDLVKTFLRWANDIRLLCEADERSKGLIENIIIWCQSHEGNNGFSWKNNILSGKKLREKFPVLYGQYMQQNKTHYSFNGYREQAEKIIHHLNEKSSINRDIFFACELPELSLIPWNDSNLNPVVNALKSGKSIQYCMEVVDIMTSQWKFSEKMRQYLRPGTLFKPEKIEEYHSMALKKWYTLDDGATWQEDKE